MYTVHKLFELICVDGHHEEPAWFICVAALTGDLCHAMMAQPEHDLTDFVGLVGDDLDFREFISLMHHADDLR